MQVHYWQAMLLLIIMADVAGIRAAPPVRKDLLVLEPFDYHGVTLRDGFLKRQFDETRAYYLRIANDDLLRGFRVRAGRPAPGKDLGGWYGSDTFHIFGQIVSGLARMYAATGDAACRDKVNSLVDGWGECIAADGFFYYSNTPGGRHYIYDKTVCGLVDAYLYAGNSQALSYLSRITDWAVQHLDRTRPYGADGNEWYTLSENLYRAYLVTGDTKYRDFAQVWEYTEYWNRYALKQNLFGPGSNGKTAGAYHAYSHVNTLSGAGEAYLVTGDSHYLDVLRNAYDSLQHDQCFVTGGYGPDEQLLPRSERDRHLADTTNTFETQCGTWAGFKLSKYLMSFTGAARYGDWIERLIYNGVGVSLPMTADGRVFYYANYNPSGATKVSSATGWTCCAGTRPQVVADFHDLIYFKDAGTLYVNLYTPSTVQWQHGTTPVTLRQETRYPEEESVVFTVGTRHPTSFALALRHPAWLTEPARLTLNGKTISIAPDARGWLVVRRTWHNDDSLTLTLPMRFTVERLTPDHPYPAAVLHGPVVLTFRTDHNLTKQSLNLNQLDQLAAALAPSPGEPLTYHLARDPAVLVRPFYTVPEGERYYLYLDPAAANHVLASDVKFSGQWNQATGFRFSNSVGATAEYAFEGTGVRWRGQRFDDAGRAEVRLDGKVVAVVDQYGPGRGLPFDWKTEGLPAGKHIITITVLEAKTPASKDRYVNVAGFDVLKP